MDVSSGTHKTLAFREPDPELVIENKTDENIPGVVLNKIKIEPSEVDWEECHVDNKEAIQLPMNTYYSEEFEVTGRGEQYFIKNEDNQNTEAMSFLNRIKNEDSEVDNLDGCTASDNEDIKFQLGAVKPETDMDSEEFRVTEITEELIIKSENETSMDATSDVASNSMTKSKFQRNQHQVVSKKAGRKSFSCYNCNHTAYSKSRLMRHLKMHDKQKYVHFFRPASSKIHECKNCTYKTSIEDDFLQHLLRHPDTTGTASSYNLSMCIHCDATFKRKVSLDDHIVRKHPDFVTSIARKIYECTECPYKTTIKNNFNIHMSVHGLSDRLSRCIHCSTTFKCKASLDDHIIRKHPNFTTSVDRKIYECTRCIYKTILKTNFNRHMSIHLGTASSCTCTCIHCNATLKSKRALDDHVVRKHPNLAVPVGRKIFECTECIYRTIPKSFLATHMLTHFKTFSSYKLGTCIHCNATFRSTRGLDDHVVKNHPNSIASVARKIHECTKCGYKTILKYDFDKHNAAVHPGVASHFKLRICIHCNATFKSNTLLDDHIVKKHPDFITSVTSKLHECSECIYKTTIKQDFNRHMLVHTVTASSYELSRCNHCNATFKRKTSLNDHILKKHPNFFTSGTKKIYKCTKCVFKTTVKKNFDRHASSSVHFEAE